MYEYETQKFSEHFTYIDLFKVHNNLCDSIPI